MTLAVLKVLRRLACYTDALFGFVYNESLAPSALIVSLMRFYFYGIFVAEAIITQLQITLAE